jgi:hypothetical protein
VPAANDRYAPFTFLNQANILKLILEDAQRVRVPPPTFDALGRLSSFKDSGSSAGFGRWGLEVTLWGSKLVNGSPTTRL